MSLIDMYALPLQIQSVISWTLVLGKSESYSEQHNL